MWCFVYIWVHVMFCVHRHQWVWVECMQCFVYIIHVDISGSEVESMQCFVYIDMSEPELCVVFCKYADTVLLWFYSRCVWVCICWYTNSTILLTLRGVSLMCAAAAVLGTSASCVWMARFTEKRRPSQRVTCSSGANTLNSSESPQLVKVSLGCFMTDSFTIISLCQESERNLLKGHIHL